MVINAIPCPGCRNNRYHGQYYDRELDSFIECPVCKGRMRILVFYDDPIPEDRLKTIGAKKGSPAKRKPGRPRIIQAQPMPTPPPSPPDREPTIQERVIMTARVSIEEKMRRLGVIQSSLTKTEVEAWIAECLR